MTSLSEPVIASADEQSRDGWDDPRRGRVSWVTLFSRDITPTAGLSAGVAEIAPGCGLNLHRHAEAEVYLIIEGEGLVSIDGRDTKVKRETAVFIPGDALHGIRNDAEMPLRFFYCFPADSFSDVVYRWPEPEPAS